MDTYEKAYKEALEKAKYWHNEGYGKGCQEVVEDIFPELKESEDEKVRKAIIELVRQSSEVLNEQNQKDMLAWLEKQKEPELSEDLSDYIAELSKQFPEVSFAKLSRIAVSVKNWLEKQGEMSKMCPTSVQDEQQPIDKVEPKFKVGDWIIHQGTENIYQVVSRIDNQYQLKYGDNYTIQKCADVDKDARLWTIDDAKDGDVLADDDNNIFIFDGTVEEGKYPFAYCGLTAQGFDSYDIRLPFTHDNNIHPATLEQRNLLFKKMKESGYEWDDEKKELKKIEKKSQRMVSAEVKEALYDKPTDEEMKELLRTEYEKGRADTIAEMEKDWSEEDVKKPNGGIVLEDFNDGNGFYKVNLAYLNEEQVKEIEELVKRWDCQPKENEDESIISDLLV